MNLLSISQRLTRVEELISHRDHLVDQLNSIVYEQALQIEKLEKETTALRQQLQAIAPSQTLLPSEDSPPPHY